jgi:hypothetical protein
MTENDSPIVAYTIFCDDVRAEVGNKISYMGVYQGVMFVDAFPLALPRLCVAVTVRMPKQVVQRSRPLVFRIFANDSVIAERAFEPEIVIAAASEPVHDVVHASAFFQFTPFASATPTRLKARAYLDGTEIKAGTLDVRLLTESAAAVK